jgi:hypothetical protein
MKRAMIGGRKIKFGGEDKSTFISRIFKGLVRKLKKTDKAIVIKEK